ncbi:MAG: zinc ribbon domain-containing protein [Desulfobulbaceae bacterium]|nr:zinc ribbon domain-containing protein [Desulfobulbaceae bacterium]MCK5341645.1 zinc ribbon domain-containing protein [Desulfobulbaceae bacterium]MCK5404489.1 zinc ribbon domain-containing protein [Desulfobulbaceae bacterium]
MPVYEYECESCEKILETWQSMSEAPMTICPSCSGELKKIISMSSFQLKGGGWYADGYSSASANTSCSGKPCAESSSSASKDSGGGSCAQKESDKCACAN